MIVSLRSLWNRLRLSTRINVVTASILLVTMAGFVALDYVRERRALLEVKVEELATIASVVSSDLASLPPELTREEVRAAALERAGPLVSLHVVEGETVMASSSDRELSLEGLTRVAWSTGYEAWWTPGGLAVSVAYPRSPPSANAVKVFAEASLAPIERLLGRTLRMHVLHGIATVAAMALGVAWVLKRAILDPCARMISAMSAMERGTWNVDVPLSYEDEVGVMMKAFNRVGKNLTRTALTFARVEKLSALALVSTRVSKQLDSPLRELELSASRLLALSSDEAVQEARLIKAAVLRSRDAIAKIDRVFFEDLGATAATNSAIQPSSRAPSQEIPG